MTSTAASAAGRKRSTSALLPMSGLAMMGAAAALLAVLHVLPQTEGISAVEDTISKYAFTPVQWLFSLAVLVLALGTTCVFAALLAQRVVAALSVTTVAAGLWTAGLLLIVIFEKTDWTVGPSVSGTIHRLASVVAFLALPLAVITGVRAVSHRGMRLLAQLLATSSWLCFGIILAALAWMIAGGPPWWQAVPLGLVQRAIAVTSVLAVAVLAAGLARSVRSAPDT